MTPALITLLIALASTLPFVRRQANRGFPVTPRGYINRAIIATGLALLLSAGPFTRPSITAMSLGLFAFLIVLKTDTPSIRKIPTETMLVLTGAGLGTMAWSLLAGSTSESIVFGLLATATPLVISTLLFLLGRGGSGDITLTLALTTLTFWWVPIDPMAPLIAYLALAVVLVITVLAARGHSRRTVPVGPALAAYYLALTLTTVIGATS